MKIKSLLLTILLASIMSLTPNNIVKANSTYTSGDYTYTIANNKAEIVAYEGSNSNVTIPSKLGKYAVSKIGYNAFRNCQEIENIIIPASIETIDSNAFSGCNFTTVKFANNCKMTVFNGFGDMNKLKSINIPNNVKKIEGYALSNDTALRTITIPASVTEIGYRAFGDCTGLTTMNIPTNVSKIDSNAFAGCNFTTVKFADNCKITVFDGFDDMNKLKSINIPNNVKKIEGYALSNDTALRTITIPASVTEIGYRAFGNCTGLTTMNIPTNVSKIDSNAFSGCNFTTVKFANNCKITVFNGFGDMNKLKSINIPNNVKKIEGYALRNDTALTTITIPTSVTEIGYRAFGNCTGLTKISIPRRVEKIDSNAFSDCKFKTVSFANDCMITEFPSFSSMSTLTSINIPRNVKKIDGYTFSSNLGLSNITIPVSVTEIGYHAFDNCSNLTIEIPSNVKTIDDYAFTGTSNLTIKCENNSYAQNYCKNKSIKYVTTTITKPKVPVNISKCTITGYGAKGYTGKAITQSLIIKNGNTTLKNGTDYIVEYANNTSMGNAKMLIVGFGSYCGKVSKSFKIVPTTVTKLQTLKRTVSSITLKWAKNAGNISGYKIYFYNPSNKSYEQIATTTGTSYTIKGLKAGTTYRYAVKAYATISNVTYVSNAYSTIISTTTTPVAPKVTSTPVDTKYIKLSWNKVNGASAYVIEMYNTSQKKWKTLKTTKDRTFTVSGLKEGTIYKFRVRAYKNWSNNSKIYSAYSSVITESSKPIIPKFTSITTGNKNANIKWGKVSASTGYEIYMATGANAKYNKIATITKNSKVSYNKTKLSKGKKYFFKIRAYKIVNNKKVYSKYSAVKTIVVK